MKTLYILIIHYQHSDLLVPFHAEDMRDALQQAGKTAHEKGVDLIKHCDLRHYPRGFQGQFDVIPGELPDVAQVETPQANP